MKAGDGHFEFSRLLANCILCCSNDNVFFYIQRKHGAPFVLHVNVRNDDVVTVKNNNFVVVKDNGMPFGTVT